MTTRTTLTPSQLSKLRMEHPELPDAYLTYLADVGWGEAESGRTIYEGPIAPSEIYGEGKVEEDVLLLGDDFQGYCLAFHRTAKILGEVDPKGRWEPWQGDRTFSSYVANDYNQSVG